MRGVYKKTMTEQELKKLGFKRKWLSDRSGYWMQLDIDCFLKNCHVTTDLDRNHLTLWCTDIESTHHVIIAKINKDKDSILNLIQRLKR